MSGIIPTDLTHQGATDDIVQSLHDGALNGGDDFIPQALCHSDLPDAWHFENREAPILRRDLIFQLLPDCVARLLMGGYCGIWVALPRRPVISYSDGPLCKGKDLSVGWGKFRSIGHFSPSSSTMR